MASRALSIAARRPSLKSASLACTALVSVGLWAEAAAQPAPATPQTLAARIAAAHSGETILLASGAYGPLHFNARKFSGAGLVIEAQPGAKPVFSSIMFDGASEGITLKNVEVYDQTEKFAVNIDGAIRINLIGLTIHGPADKPPIGMMLHHGYGVVVADSNLSHLEHGINMSDSDGLQILRNTFHDVQCDAIRGASSHVEVIGNHGSDFHPLPGDHPDFIQFWSSPEAGPSTGNRIKDNVFQRGHGDPVQGVFIEDNKDIVISGNAMLGPMYNAISLARVQGAVVEDNFMQSYPDMAVHIITRGASADVTVRNNVAPQVVNYTEDGKPNPNYREQGNRPIKVAQPGDASAMQDWLAKRSPH
jgi:hypothetical protein